MFNVLSVACKILYVLFLTQCEKLQKSINLGLIARMLILHNIFILHMAQYSNVALPRSAVYLHPAEFGICTLEIFYYKNLPHQVTPTGHQVACEQGIYGLNTYGLRGTLQNPTETQFSEWLVNLYLYASYMSCCLSK